MSEISEISEIEALKSAKNSYNYALNVLQGRFEKGENAISKDAEYSKSYRENIYDAKKKIEKEFKDLRDSIDVHYLYGIEV